MQYRSALEFPQRYVTHILKFGCSSAGTHSCSTSSSRDTGLQGSTLHSFSSTPTHSTFFSLDCAPLCPIYCLTVPAVLPPKPKIVAPFLPPPLFLASSSPSFSSPEVLPQSTFSRTLFHVFPCQSCFKQPAFQGKKRLTMSAGLC